MPVREEGGKRPRLEGAMFCEGWDPGGCVTTARGSVTVGFGAAKWPEGGRWLCVCRGEKGLRGGQEASDGEGRGSRVGLIKGWHHSDGSGSAGLSMWTVCACARVRV